LVTDQHANAQMARYWTEVGGPHWVHEQHQFDQMLAAFGAELRRVLDAQPGEHILDVGCGTGTSTIDLANSVGTTGSVVGCDISPTMIDAARARTSEIRQISFAIADAQIADMLQADLYDAVHSRFGVMFFVDPVAAFANIAEAVRPGGRLAFVCWQGEAANEWIALPARILRSFATGLEVPPTGAPGPFAFQDAARIEQILADAGWTDVRVSPFSAPTVMGGGAGVDAALTQAMGTRVAQLLREQIDEATFALAEEAVRLALADHLDADGAVTFTGNVWIVTATRP
jgi:SAM-dependent methyltransferase